MCGVVAAVGITARAALPLIRHRGPDAEGVVDVAGVSLAHTRLAILDLDRRSDQPFRSGAVTISFNGEVWNYKAVRADLEALGRTFRTAGDTEVVAAALDAWDPDEALRRLDGMFAIAWADDRRPGVLQAARDRFGEVPLHLAWWADAFAVASEVAPLLALGAPPSEVRWLGPGERLTLLRPGALDFVRWYDPPAEPVPVTLEEAGARVRKLLRAGVTQRAVSDAPVCTLLSGGIDSAIVAAFLARVVPGLVAYHAVMDERSPDLVAARETAVRSSAPSSSPTRRRWRSGGPASFSPAGCARTGSR